MRSGKGKMIMKKYLTLVFIFLLNILYSVPENLLAGFPTFQRQIDNNIEEGINKTELILKLQKYLHNADDEMRKGLKMVLFESEYRDAPEFHDSSRKKVNYALQLFLHLLSKGCYLEGDSITFALALANNWLYSIATPEARLAIKEDIVKHYEYYLKIIRWQETLPIHIRLKKYPLLPKLFWANRYIHLDNRNKMTLSDYQEFIDRIETLEGFHQIVLENKLHIGYRFKTIARKIIRFAVKHNQYRGYLTRYIETNTLHRLKPEVLRDYNAGEYETFYYGRKRKWMTYKWMNYQYKRYRQTGFTRGDCITFSRVQSAIFKACGIPSTECYRSTHLASGVSDHLFVVYYNGFLNKWDQHDYIFKREARALLKFPRIRWHHLMKRFQQETSEYTTNSLKNALFIRGIENWHFEQLVFNPLPVSQTRMFDHPQAVYTLNDMDNDGIPDEIEKKLGLNAQTPDSDNDGYSDLWELEYGYNPLDAQSPGRTLFPVISGTSHDRQFTDDYSSVTSEEGDYSAFQQIYNVKTVFARIFQNELYIAVTFYNDIRKNGQPYHNLSLETTGNTSEKYSLRLFKQIVLKKGRKKMEAEGIEYASITSLNLVIPLKYFSGGSSIKITYYGYGKKGRKKMTGAKRSKVLTVSWG